MSYETNMRSKKQDPIHLKVRMLQKQMSVTALARRVGHARTTVSRAINHGHNSGVLSKVKEVLDV